MKAESYLLLKKAKAWKKVLLCMAIALVIVFAMPWKNVDMLSQAMIGWVTFSLCILIADWIVFFHTPPRQIRKQAQVEDGSRYIVFVIVLVSTLASLLAVGLLLIQQDDKNRVLHVLVAVSSMLFSWVLVHTIFAVRYAHMFYGDHQTKENVYAGGLDFPNENNSPNDTPDFIDFAYFSFVLGMTFQVSDVQITSRRLRRLVLAHSLISFVYNTMLLALTINTLAK